MTDKPQTLAEKISKPHNDLIARLKGRSSFCRDRGEVKTPDLLDAAAAALADAAATTPVVVGEQAGDVRQAVSIKPLVWVDVPTFDFECYDALGMGVLYRIIRRADGQYWLVEPNTVCPTLDLAKAAAYADKVATITSALEPYPMPVLSWRAMQTAAAEKIKAHGNTARLKMRAAHEAEDINDYDGWSAIVAHLDIAHDAILALPGPTDEQALAEAVKLAAVQELVAAVKRLNDACDAMWNDQKRLEKNSSSFGQPYQIKEVHIKAISEAQQALPDVLAQIGGAA